MRCLGQWHVGTRGRGRGQRSCHLPPHVSVPSWNRAEAGERSSNEVGRLRWPPAKPSAPASSRGCSASVQRRNGSRGGAWRRGGRGDGGGQRGGGGDELRGCRALRREMRGWGGSPGCGEGVGGVGEARGGSGRPDALAAEPRRRWPDSGHAATGLSGDERVGGATREDAGKLVEFSRGEEMG